MSTPREELRIDEAPSVFHLSDHPSPESYEDSVAVERCPVCRSGRHPLYCQECVKNEEISHRKLSFTSFCDGMGRLHKLICTKDQLTRDVETKMRSQYKVAEQKRLVTVQRQKMASLQSVLSAKSSLCESKRKAITQKRSDNKRLDKTVSRIRSRIPLISERVSSLTEKVSDRQARQQSVDSRLVSRRRDVIRSIEKFVFNIEPVQNSRSMHETDDPITQELADASSHQFVRGRWAYVDTANKLAYKIVESQLLSSGDLIELHDYCAEHTGAGVATPRNTDVRMTSMALEEWAALSNLSQFSHCVANILDVNLPYTTYIPRLSLDALTTDELSNFRAQLDFNISYLSCSQGVDMLTYDPRRSILNMFHLVHHCDHIGRCTPFSLVTTSLLQSVEERITNAYIAQQFDGDKCDEDDSDWSIVTESPPTETSAVQTMSYAASASDLVSSAVNVMSSYWPFKQ